jgi:hypothetical protein
MAGMAQGIMTLAATIGIPGASVEGHIIPTMWSEFMDHRVLPMSHPLVPSWEFLLCNPNPISPSPDLEVYPAHYNIIFKIHRRPLTFSRRRNSKLTNPECRFILRRIIK